MQNIIKNSHPPLLILAEGAPMAPRIPIISLDKKWMLLIRSWMIWLLSRRPILKQINTEICMKYLKELMRHINILWREEWRKIKVNRMKKWRRRSWPSVFMNHWIDIFIRMLRRRWWNGRRRIAGRRCCWRRIRHWGRLSWINLGKRAWQLLSFKRKCGILSILFSRKLSMRFNRVFLRIKKIISRRRMHTNSFRMFLKSFSFLKLKGNIFKSLRLLYL